MRYRIRISGYVDTDDMELTPGAAMPATIEDVWNDWNIEIGVFDLEGVEVKVTPLSGEEAAQKAAKMAAAMARAERVGEEYRRARTEGRKPAEEATT